MTLDLRAAVDAARWGIAGAHTGDGCCVACSAGACCVAWGWLRAGCCLRGCVARESCCVAVLLRDYCVRELVLSCVAGRARCWCLRCARLMLHSLAGWFAAGVLQTAREENNFWKIRDFVNSKFFF